MSCQTLPPHTSVSLSPLPTVATLPSPPWRPLLHPVPSLTPLPPPASFTSPIPDASKFISGCMQALSAMVKMELPHVNILTKMDICPDKVCLWGRGGGRRAGGRFGKEGEGGKEHHDQASSPPLPAIPLMDWPGPSRQSPLPPAEETLPRHLLSGA